MKILTLKLENFQGIKSAEFDFEGQNTSIYGDNATGKTTIFNAITWLLFDRASTGAKNYTPKTKGSDGDLHYLDHAATARFALEDGRIITIKKTFHENYKKKRGSAVEEFDGHSVDFYIDGVPVKEKEYSATLLAFCGGAEKMKMLTMPNYFAEEMAWDARRRILLEICGDISDKDVIAATPELSELEHYLAIPAAPSQHYTIDEYKKIASAQQSDINNQLAALPGRIDEAARAIPDIDEIDKEFIDAQIEELQALRDTILEEKASAMAGNTAIADAKRATAEATVALAESRATYMEKITNANQDTQAEIAKIQFEISGLRENENEAKSEAAATEKKITRLAATRKELLSEYARTRDEAWDESQAICPTCGRELPLEQIEGLRSNFNIEKSRKLQAINERGRSEASNDIIAAATREYEEWKAKAEEAEWRIADLTIRLNECKAKIITAAPFETTEEYSNLSARVEMCRKSETTANTNAENITQGINSKIADIQQQIQELQAKKTKFEQAELQKQRIEELSAQEKALSAQYEETEKGIYLCNVFTKAKVGMLTNRINEKFKNVRFRLFINQVNGGIKDDCEVMIPTDTGRLVPYAYANNAARINAGLEIINVLSAHWGITMPVFIDNAESITHIADINTQIVRLVVSEPDKALRLEIEGENAA